MLTNALVHKLVVTVFVVLMGMVLWGVVEIQTLFEAVGALALLRSWSLIRQWNRRTPTEQEWTEMAARLAESMLPDGTDEERSAALSDILASPEYLAKLKQLRIYTQVRDRRDLCTELVYLNFFMPVSILLVLMLTSNIVSFNGVARWPGVTGVAVAISLYFIPNLYPVTNVARRLSVRTGIAIIVLAGTIALAETRHPYLLKLGPERRRMQAMQVLKLGTSVEAYRHADMLFAYANDLKQAGLLEEALKMYEQGLEMAPRDAAAHNLCAEIDDKLGRGAEADRHRAMANFATIKPGQLLVSMEQARPLPVLQPRPRGHFTLCLVPYGDVPIAMLDWVGREIEARSHVPTCRFPKTFALPDPDRRNGFLGSVQWNVEPLLRDFYSKHGPFIRSPIQYLIVSSGDIYTSEANFVFAAGASGFGCVSFARLHTHQGSDPTTDPLLIDRLAKVALSCSIKSLGVPPSKDPDCVTAYCQDLDQCDQKAPTPSATTDRLYRDAIRRFEEDFRAEVRYELGR